MSLPQRHPPATFRRPALEVGFDFEAELGVWQGMAPDRATRSVNRGPLQPPEVAREPEGLIVR